MLLTELIDLRPNSTARAPNPLTIRNRVIIALNHLGEATPREIEKFCLERNWFDDGTAKSRKRRSQDIYYTILTTLGHLKKDGIVVIKGRDPKSTSTRPETLYSLEEKFKLKNMTPDGITKPTWSWRRSMF